MKVLIDVGNTALKVALYDEGNYRFTSVKDIPWDKVTDLVYAQVGADTLLTPVLELALSTGCRITEAKVSAQLGQLACAYPNYQNLGIDRWLGVVAAFVIYPNQDCIVIDAGTATTVDILSAEGKHLGGWIIPGLDLMVESIASKAQKVFDDEQVGFTLAMGTNTPEALKNGVLAATVGSVGQAHSVLKGQAKHFNTDSPRIIFTGGYGEMLCQHVPNSEFDELFIMKGLLAWLKLNQGD